MLTPQLEQWKSWIRRDLGGYSDPEKLLRTMKLAADEAYGNTKAEWTLWTRRNRFTFVLRVRRRAIITPPYFGCAAMGRCWRAGEDWHRGRDLPDGDFSEDLWRRMLLAILSYELDEPVLPQPVPPAPVTEGPDGPIAVLGTVTVSESDILVEQFMFRVGYEAAQRVALEWAQQRIAQVLSEITPSAAPPVEHPA